MVRLLQSLVLLDDGPVLLLDELQLVGICWFLAIATIIGLLQGYANPILFPETVLNFLNPRILLTTIT
jgi:hypothetical protein